MLQVQKGSFFCRDVAERRTWGKRSVIRGISYEVRLASQCCDALMAGPRQESSSYGLEGGGGVAALQGSPGSFVLSLSAAKVNRCGLHA